MKKEEKRKPRKCPDCGGKLEEETFCEECNRPLDEPIFRCQKCFGQFDENKKEV